MGIMSRHIMANSAGLYPPMGSAGRTKTAKRTRAKLTRKTRGKSKTRRVKKNSRLVKGSAAAKAYMAKIRRKRRR